MRPPYLVHELPAPTDPAGRMLALQAADPVRYPVLLESAAGSPLARYSLLLAAPGERLVLDAVGRLSGPGRAGGFCGRLDEWWHEGPREPPPVPWPFAGGWFLYLGYELAGEVEPTLCLPPSPLPIVAMAWRMRAALLLEHATGRTVAVAEADAEGELDRLRRDFRSAAVAAPPSTGAAPVIEEDDPELYLAACRRALLHIAAGDIYQANLARCWRARMPEGLTAPALYAALRRANPGDFAGIARLDDLAIISSSPERLVRVRGRRIDTRPIAGTRPRTGRDSEAIAAMTGSAKERAEHVMLIDLERNDLGRICEAGTVHVDEFMAVESYAHVHHIVSNVSGRLRADAAPGAVIRALFPGGTITGCPKVRCMQLIGELEGRGRGAYTGAMGYLTRDGDMDLNILIRTATIHREEVELRAGAGIVADSVPERELEETRAKARGLLRALGSVA